MLLVTMMGITQNDNFEVSVQDYLAYLVPKVRH